MVESFGTDGAALEDRCVVPGEEDRSFRIPADGLIDVEASQDRLCEPFTIDTGRKRFLQSDDALSGLIMSDGAILSPERKTSLARGGRIPDGTLVQRLRKTGLTIIECRHQMRAHRGRIDFSQGMLTRIQLPVVGRFGRLRGAGAPDNGQEEH